MAFWCMLSGSPFHSRTHGSDQLTYCTSHTVQGVVIGRQVRHSAEHQSSAVSCFRRTLDTYTTLGCSSLTRSRCMYSRLLGRLAWVQVVLHGDRQVRSWLPSSCLTCPEEDCSSCSCDPMAELRQPQRSVGNWPMLWVHQYFTCLKDGSFWGSILAAGGVPELFT